MGYQAFFKRYEIKYIITADQKDRILKAMEPYMEHDSFGHSSVRNIYFDTDDFVLARHSIAKPDFKEKLRIRSYSKADEDSTVFVELKRKFDGVVYKRRIGLPEREAMKWMAGSNDTALRGETGYGPHDPSAVKEKVSALNDFSKKGENGYGPHALSAEKKKGSAPHDLSINEETGYGPHDPSAEKEIGAAPDDLSIKKESRSGYAQVADEIEYFRNLYKGLKPVLYLSYDRTAYRMKSGMPASDGGEDFRVTFDSSIICREGDLSLRSEVYGTPVLDEGMFLMELKCTGAIPLWMTSVLSEEKIYKTSFSKYGRAYCGFMSEAPRERSREIAAAGQKKLEHFRDSKKSFKFGAVFRPDSA